MIDTLRDSLATQGQIADTLRDALPMLFIVAALLVVVVLLLIMLIAAQRQTLSALRDMLSYVSDIHRTLENLDYDMTIQNIVMAQKNRRHRKRLKRLRKRRKSEPRKKK